MPYNTRRKSLSLPSLGIHVPVTHAARAAASKSASRSVSSPSTALSATPATMPSASRSESPDSPPIKRRKRSHGSVSSGSTPPPSPTPATSIEMSDDDAAPKIDLEGIKDDIVEAVIVQLQRTGNRPHLIKELAIVLGQHLTSVQQSANPCAIICSRLAGYIKRPCWSAIAPCPLAKELEPVHPRRTFYYLTTCPRQDVSVPIIPVPNHASIITPSVSLTDDTGSDYIEGRRRELSPSPEVDLSSPEFDDVEDDLPMPSTPMGSFPKRRSTDLQAFHNNNSPPLEKDEREFTQTADVLQKRKLTDPVPSDPVDRGLMPDPWQREDVWFADTRPMSAATFMSSPAIRPMVSSARKDDEADSWLKFNKLFEWDKGAESIEIDELDCLLDDC